jgi:N-methylhydantoinase A
MARSGSAILDRERVREADRRVMCGIDARYEGQNFEVYVGLDGLDPGGDPDPLDREFAARFRAVHRATYGYDIPGRAVEIVTLRLKMIGRGKKPKSLFTPSGDSGKPKPIARRSVCFDLGVGWLDTPIYDRARLPIGAQVSGPAIIEEMSATTLLHPGDLAMADAAGNLIINVQLQR